MNASVWLRRFSKLVVFSTLFLIFAGSMVTSTGSGLSVPDWPLSYGMLFPPMVGGVFYEHGHRMIALAVGFLTLIFAVWLGLSKEEKWLKILGFCALLTVILQGVLGGITVLFLLPTSVSVSHAVLSQTFFVLTLILAYGLSQERSERKKAILAGAPNGLASFTQFTFCVSITVYIQLILGAVMRHTGSGLAIPDFPTMGGSLSPSFDSAMLAFINEWRSEINLDPVTLTQVFIHLSHRVMALLITLLVFLLDYKAIEMRIANPRVLASLVLLNLLLISQITLGAFTVWSEKQPWITSLHVVTGAAILGMSILLTLQSAPATFFVIPTKEMTHRYKA
ncbi:MAG: COX15/CtaA family protein [Candidatus Omnitrophica bacterium]|nr:COX15/CtaA family protein [Candidatus Omnitrophota bacterium]